MERKGGKEGEEKEAQKVQSRVKKKDQRRLASPEAGTNLASFKTR